MKKLYFVFIFFLLGLFLFAEPINESKVFAHSMTKSGMVQLNELEDGGYIVSVCLYTFEEEDPYIMQAYMFLFESLDKAKMFYRAKIDDKESYKDFLKMFVHFNDDEFIRNRETEYMEVQGFPAWRKVMYYEDKWP